MEGITAKIADGAKGSSLILCHHALGGILDDLQPMAARDPHDLVHLAGYARVMNNDDHPRPFRDCGFDLPLVKIHCIRPDIDKNKLCSGQHGCVGSGGKRVTWKDDFVARL